VLIFLYLSVLFLTKIKNPGILKLFIDISQKKKCRYCTVLYAKNKVNE